MRLFDCGGYSGFKGFGGYPFLNVYYPFTERIMDVAVRNFVKGGAFPPGGPESADRFRDRFRLFST